MAAGAIMMISMQRLTTKGQSAYGEAGGLAGEAFSGIRTVVSFCAEDLVLERYKKYLQPAVSAGIKGGFFQGLGSGCVFLIFYGTYSLSLWYGGILVVDADYSGGKVLTVCIIKESSLYFLGLFLYYI